MCYSGWDGQLRGVVSRTQYEQLNMSEYLAGHPASDPSYQPVPTQNNLLSLLKLALSPNVAYKSHMPPPPNKTNDLYCVLSISGKYPNICDFVAVAATNN